MVSTQVTKLVKDLSPDAAFPSLLLLSSSVGWFVGSCVGLSVGCVGNIVGINVGYVGIFVGSLVGVKVQ